MKSVKKAVNFLLAVVLTLSLLTATTYFVLKKNKTPTDSGLQNVPYYEENPTDNVGLLFRFENNSSIFFNLDYYNEKVSVILFNEKIPRQTVLDYGYSATFVFDTDYVFVADFIDRFSGLELENSNGLQRYTGIQITAMLESGEVTPKQVIAALLSKINYWGFSKNDLTFIIKNTKTELSYPTGYPLISRLPALCLRVNFIN